VREQSVEAAAGREAIMDLLQETRVVLDLLEHIEQAHGRETGTPGIRSIESGVDDATGAAPIRVARAGTGFDSDGGESGGLEGEGLETVAGADVVDESRRWKLLENLHEYGIAVTEPPARILHGETLLVSLLRV